MNKKNKILVGCLALLLALSVGYALFSDTITINGTATAKGSFDITPSCETGIASIFGTAESLGIAAEGGYDKSECLVDDDKITMSVNFTMPGGIRYFTTKFANTGTIDAVLNIAENNITIDQICVADNLAGDNEECVNKNVLKGYFAYNASIFESIGLAGIIVEDDKGNILSSEEALEFIDLTNGTFWLKPGYSGYVVQKISIYHNGSAYPSNEMNVKYIGEYTNTWNQKTN